MNFISTFDELNKLYESTNKTDGQVKEGWDEEAPLGKDRPYYSGPSGRVPDTVPQWWKDQGGTEATWRQAQSNTGKMNNWRNAWESVEGQSNEKLDEYYDEEAPLGRDRPYYTGPSGRIPNTAPQWWKDQGGTEATWRQAQSNDKEMNNHRPVWEDLEDDAADEAPRQLIIECDKCGALVIKDEADIVVDEETDLVNVEDECQFCEEAKGFKIIGVVAPYEPAVEEESVEEEPAEEAVEESLNNSKLLKEIEKTNELKTEHESEYLTLNEEADIIDEDLADVTRKVFDRPASIKTQQYWEDELVDLQVALETETDERKKAKMEKRIKQLENKFANQRDWEKRHSDKMEESLEVSPELEKEIKDLVGLYADKLDISSSSDNPNVPSGQVQICTFIRSEASKTAHKEMIDIFKKAGYKVASEFDAGVNPLIKAHMSFITITK